MVVCDTTNLECMVHRCKNCPGYPVLEKISEQICRIRGWWGEVNQLQRIDKSHTHTADADDFIDLLVYSVNNLTTHSFIAKGQAQHLKLRKEEITDKVYHCLRLYWELSLYGAWWSPGKSLVLGPVYHASCGDIFQEGWCTSSHLTVQQTWAMGNLPATELVSLSNAR